MKKVLALLLLSCVIAGCEWIANDLTNNFADINRSLERSNKNITATNDAERKTISSYKPQNIEIVSRVDSITETVSIANNLLELFKTSIIDRDTTGKDVGAVEYIMSTGKNKKLLRMHMFNVYNHAHTIFIYCGKPKLDNTLTGLQEVQTDTAWVRKYFGAAMPSIAAITTLSKLQNECLTAEKNSLDALKTKLIKN